MEYYSDFSTLINLALVTVLYSTLIAPSLKKLSDLREDIADITFSKNQGNTPVDPQDDPGAKLKKKLVQYGDKYAETRFFLWFFYGILLVIFGSQIYLLATLTADKLGAEDWVKVGIAVSIVVLLSVAIELFMKRPGKIESIQWLTNHGITETFTRPLFNADLIMNLHLRNLEHDPTCIDFVILSEMKKRGYSYVINIESTDGKKLYYSAGGRVRTRSHFGFAYASNDGSSRSFIAITNKFKLRPGHYKVRLLLFQAPFRGSFAAHETIMHINDDDGIFDTKLAHVTYNDMSGPYQFAVNAHTKVKSISVDEGSDNEAAQKILLSKNFLRYFSKARRPYSIQSTNGLIEQIDVDRAFRRRNVALKRLVRLFKRNKDDKRAVWLLKKN